MTRVALLGATGSIGRQALDVIAANPELELVAATSGSTPIEGVAPVTQVGGDPVELLERAQPDVVLNAVDSEHSATFQCLEGREPEQLDALVLTASGGPFRGRTRVEVADVGVEDALAHPTWAMGPKITVDSATLANKGLEVIEAHFLFGLVRASGGRDPADVGRPRRGSL